MPDQRPLGSIEKKHVAKQKRYLYGFTGAFALLMFIGLAHLSNMNANGQADVNRNPAAIKDSFAMKRNAGFVKHTRKILGPLSAEIINVTGVQPKSGDRFTLRAKIVSSKALHEVDLTWYLPEGVELISGQTKESLLDLKANEVEEREITLQLHSDKNEKIFLQVRSKDEGSQFSHAAQFNTLKQSQIDQEKEALSERHQQYLRSVHRRHKIFQ